MFTFKKIELKEEIGRYIKQEQLHTALKEESTQQRLGLIAQVIQDAARDSSLTTFSGRTYFFNGRVYEPIEPNAFSDFIYDLMREIGVKAGDILFKGRDVVRMANMAVQRKTIEYDPNKICFTNGVYDIKNDKFSDFSPKHCVFTAVDYPFDPMQDSPENAYLWHRFLREVLPDEGARDVLQEFLGLLFIDRKEIKVDVMLFMLGRGANGKSVIFNVINGLIGSANISNYDLSDLITSKDKSHNLASINGKRLNYCSDISAKVINSESFKAIVSGEPQPARFLYGNPFMAYDMPFIIANGNSMPPTQDLSDGFFRRVLILPFQVEIPIEKQNPRLSSELATEYTAIFNWILQGRKRIIKNKFKFSTSEVIRTANLQYKCDNNNVYEWVRSMEFRSTELGYEARKYMSAQWLYDFYIEWCKRYSEPIYTRTKWGRSMAYLGFQKRRFDSGTTYLVYGIPHTKYKTGTVHIEQPEGMIKKLLVGRTYDKI